MKNLRRLLVLLWLFVGTGLGQSSLSSLPQGHVDSIVVNAFRPADGDLGVFLTLGDVTEVAVKPDGSGDLYVALPNYNRVYRINADRRVFHVAGTASGYSGDGGPARLARLNSPGPMVTDQDGTLYVADLGNRVIRKISPDGIITTHARALTSPPLSLALDAAKNLYVGQDRRITRIAPNGASTVVAGNGGGISTGDAGLATQAAVGFVGGIAVDPAGNIYLSDSPNRRVRKITNGIITTVAGAGFRADFGQPRGLALDASGNLYIADYYTHQIWRMDPSGNFSLVAGNSSGSFGLGGGSFTGDGGPATLAALNSPLALGVDPNGNVYFADSGNRRIRKVEAPLGTITTVAGNGLSGFRFGYGVHSIAVAATGDVYVAGNFTEIVKIRSDGQREVFAGGNGYGFSGDGEPAVLAMLADPRGFAIDRNGSLYFADAGNNRIRRVSPDGIITTVAGNGSLGFSGDGGPARQAALTFPDAVAVASDGTLYFGDNGNRRVRKVTPEGIITTIAGTGLLGFNGDGPATSRTVSGAAAIVVTASGDVIFADRGLRRIRTITADGQLRTIAGTGGFGFNGDGPALGRNVEPAGLVLDSDGVLYFSDINQNRIRKLTPQGNVETIAGTSTLGGYSGDGGPGVSAQFSTPWGLALHPSRFLYIADYGNQAIRRLALESGASFSVFRGEAVSSVSPGTGALATTGYASIRPLPGSGTPGGLAILHSLSNGVTISETAVAATPAIRSGRIFAEIGGPVNTGLSIVNPNEAEATVTFSFANSVGTSGSGVFSLAPGRQIVSFLNQSPFDLPASFHGTFSFLSSVPVAVTALRGLYNERSEFLMGTLPVVDLDAPLSGAPSAIPHYASGLGWVTRVTLMNRTDQSSSGTVVARNPDGIVLRQLSYALEGRSAQSLPLDIQTGAVSVGGISIIPSVGAGPSAFALISYVRDGVTVGSTAIPAGVPSRSVRLLAENRGNFPAGEPGSVQTGVAVANPSDSAVFVAATIGPPSLFPSTSGRALFTIPANGQLAILLSELITGPMPPEAVLKLESAQPIAAVGIRLRYNERGDALLSAGPSLVEEALPVEGPLYFPLFADSLTFTTQFTLFSAGEATAIGRLTTFSSSGTIIPLLPR
jgi:sugar lactone lactonase YvrE